MLQRFVGGVVIVVALVAGGRFWRSNPSEAHVGARRVVVPVVIEVNRGQAPAHAQFVAHQRGASFQLSARGASGVVPRRGGAAAVELEFVGAKDVAGQVEHALPGVANYLLGPPSEWVTQVPMADRVVFKGVYPGVDLVWRTHEDLLEYDFIVAPGVDPSVIQVASRGEAVAALRSPELFQRGPDGRRTAVRGGWEARPHGRFGFWVGEYDDRNELVIDPVLDFSTYLGGSGDDFASDMAVDATGATYVTGKTLSLNFPTQRPLQAMRTGPGEDCFVTKFRAGVVEYSTYLGGNLRDECASLAVNQGEVIVGGFTNSANFPVVAAFQPTMGSSSDGFIARLNDQGSALVMSSFLGGSGGDDVTALRLFGSSVYVTGTTSSSDFPMAMPFQSTLGGAQDAFVAVLTLVGTPNTLTLSSYLGGSGFESSRGIAANATGIYVVGSTDSADFPRVAALFPMLSGQGDAFITKLSPAGTVSYSTTFGGDQADQANGIQVDSMGRAYAVGLTQSTNFPTMNALSSSLRGTTDGFVTRFEATGAALGVSTYLGGSSFDSAVDVELGPNEAPCVTGLTDSNDFPLASPVQTTRAGASDLFVTQLSLAGTTLDFSTYLGGVNGEEAAALRVDASGMAHVVGVSRSANFPTSSPTQPTNAGLVDTVVVRLKPDPIDAGADAGSGDAGPTDAGPDAGAFDAGIDAGTTDAGVDAGAFDAGPPDAGTGAVVAPSFTTSPESSALCGDTYSYAPTVSGSGPFTFELRATGTAEAIPTGLRLDRSSGTVTWDIPDRTSGEFRFQVVASSAGREAAQQVVVNVTCRSIVVGCGCASDQTAGLLAVVLVALALRRPTARRF